MSTGSSVVCVSGLKYLELNTLYMYTVGYVPPLLPALNR